MSARATLAALVLALVPAAAARQPMATGTWQRLPPAPAAAALGSAASVWTGKELIVFGRLLVWTGKEMITWGGGCCGDVNEGGAAYNPATGKWRTLAKAPVAGQQRPVGAWTGRELIILPGRHADHNERTGGAAYDPAKDTWRKIASPPRERMGSNVVWDGRELLVVGGSGPPDPETGVRKLVSVPYAYDPATNRWRWLSAMDNGAYGRGDAAAVWTGKALDGIGAPDAWPFMDGATYTPGG